MKQINLKKNYLLLKNWWESLNLTNYEKNILNKEIVSFNQQLFRLREKKIRIGIYGKSGVGKSSILNLLLDKKVFETDVINGSTSKIKVEEWVLQIQSLRAIELLDSPGFDNCNFTFKEEMYSPIFNSEIILFAIAGDLNRNEVSKINDLIKDGKKVIIVLNKIIFWNKNELNDILKNIKLKLPKSLKIPVILNTEENIKEYLIDTVNLYGETLLLLNSLQSADKLLFKIKEERLKRRQKEAQSIIGKFATIKASTVAINPFILLDIAGSFALDTALINELSKVYGLSLKGESTKKIIKNISINNFFLGASQVGIHTSFNLIRKLILFTAPLTNGLSLLPYGPIAIIQAAIAVHSTKIIGKLAAKEIFIKSKVSLLEPSFIIQNIILKEPEIFKHINIYLSNRKLNNNIAIFLP